MYDKGVLMSRRLNKYLSEAGYCSRREADKLIQQGVVLVDGEVATIGSQVESTSIVMIDGKQITPQQQSIYIVLNKPIGITSTTDLKDKTNVVEYIGVKERIFPIGRLDKDSTGLLLLTNDGDIVNKVLRSSNNHEKEYVVKVNKPVTSAFLKQMREGVHILGKTTKKARVRQLHKQTFNIVLTEGMNRQIRRMCSALGYRVLSLSRIRIMNIKDDQLALGSWRYLTEEEVTTLIALTQDSHKTAVE